MELVKIRTIKVWKYKYKNQEELRNHREAMLKAKFEIEHESYLEIEFSQIIKESE